MTRIHQIVGAIFAFFGAVVSYLSVTAVSYHSPDYGPGPGFFPFWLGILLIVISVSHSILISRQPREPLPQGFIPTGTGMRYILCVIGALGAVILLLPYLGFTITMFLFSVFLLRLMSKQAWWLTVVISFTGSFGTFHLFQKLQVFLPTGFAGF